MASEDRVLDASIKCKDHPSKQAEVYCEKCGDPICADCYVMHKHCYKCGVEGLNSAIAEDVARGKIEKMKWILVVIFSAIGLIAGVAIAVQMGSEIGWSGESLISILVVIWICLGMGGNLRMTIAEFPQTYSYNREREESFGKALGWTLFMSMLMLLLRSLAGPIIPGIRIYECVKNVKFTESEIAKYKKMLKRLDDYHSYTQYIEKNGDGADLAKLTEQGGQLYNNAYANAVLNGKQESYYIIEDTPPMHGS
jgi:hypothetical protein